MIRRLSFVLLVMVLAAAAGAAVDPAASRQLYERVTPSLVAIQYVFQNELGRVELTGAGVIIGEDGLVMAPLSMFPVQIPDDQMKEFKIMVPREDGDPTEFPATFQGRDERTNLAFLHTKEAQHWKAIKFEQQDVAIGDPIFSVGMLPKTANYKSYLVEGAVSALLRGEVPQVLVTGGGLAAMGSPVFDASGKAIGMVSSMGQNPLLNEPRQELLAIMTPPRFYVPSKDFLLGLQDPPTPEKPIELPWMGVSQMSGVNKDLAEVLGIANQPAIQIGDVVPDAPADKAGLKAGDIIVKVNGKPLERGDEPAELPAIMGRKIARMKAGDKVIVSIMRDKDEPMKDVEVTLGEQPKRSNLAKRFYAEDLGFVAREMVFNDMYVLKLRNDQKGVLVALLRPQAAAQAGGLRMNDVITKLDNEPVIDLDQFKKAYQSLRKEKPKEPIVFEVHRGEREETFRIEPPQ